MPLCAPSWYRIWGRSAASGGSAGGCGFSKRFLSPALAAEDTKWLPWYQRKGTGCMCSHLHLSLFGASWHAPTPLHHLAMAHGNFCRHAPFFSAVIIDWGKWKVTRCGGKAYALHYPLRDVLCLRTKPGALNKVGVIDWLNSRLLYQKSGSKKIFAKMTQRNCEQLCNKSIWGKKNDLNG